MSLELTALQASAAFVFAVALVLVATVVKTLSPKKVGEVDEMLESMINGFDFTLPPQVEEYRTLREQAPKELGEEELKTLCSALFRRAVADIPLIRKIQTEANGINRLKTNDLIKDGSYLSFKMAEEMIGEEIKEVREEATALQPSENWGDHIFAQAVQFITHMSEQERLAEQKQQQAQAEAQAQIQKAAQAQSEMAAQMQEKMANQTSTSSEQNIENTSSNESLRKRK